MTTLGRTLKRLRILRKELAGIGFELTIGKSEYLDEAASVDTPGDVFPYRFVSVLPDGRMSWEDVNYEYRADDKRRAWLALCDDEEEPLPDPPARKVAGYERMAAAITRAGQGNGGGMMPNTDWWIRLARTSPADAAWLYLRELFESDHTHGFDDFMEDDGFMRLRAPGYSEIQVTSGGERMWLRWKAYLFTSDGRRRTVDGPRDVGLMPDRAAELFFRDIMASIEQGEDR